MPAQVALAAGPLRPLTHGGTACTRAGTRPAGLAQDAQQGSGRLRGASRITATRCTSSGSRGDRLDLPGGGVDPVGQHVDLDVGPATRRIGAAATSLTADNTAGQRLHRLRVSSTRKAGVR